MTYASRDEFLDQFGSSLRYELTYKYMICPTGCPSLKCEECEQVFAVLVGVSCPLDVAEFLVCASCAFRLTEGSTHLRVYADEADGKQHDFTIALPSGEVWRDGKPFLTPPALPE